MTLLTDYQSPPGGHGRRSSPGDQQPGREKKRIGAYDGIRAVSLFVALLFHADIAQAPGGLVGVSVFFTLSGFLITGLLLSEFQRHGRIALGQFWDRRFRRLLPAAAATVVAVTLLTPWLLGYPASRLRADAIAAALEVANWHQLFAKQSYAALLNPGYVSPLLHFWSLAVEEQFYLVFPPVAALALRAGGVRGLRRTVIVLMVLSGVVIATSHGFNAVYYNTGARAVELLAGALLAIVAAQRPGGFLSAGTVSTGGSTGGTDPPSIAGPGDHPERRPRWHAPVRTACGLAGLASLAAGTMFVHVGSPIFEHGFLAAFACANCLLIVGAGGPGPVSRLLGVAPLRWLGERSYGVYLVHWPMFLVLRHREPSWSPVTVLLVGSTLSITIAGLSYRFYERPIRAWRPSGSGLIRLTKGLIVPALAISVALVAAMQLPFAPTTTADTAQRLAENANIQAFLTDHPLAAAPDALTVSVFGDSTSGDLGQGLAVWGSESKQLAVTGGVTSIGCPVARGGLIDYLGGVNGNWYSWCDWSTFWPPEIAKHPNKVAVVLFGLLDAADRRLPGDAAFRHVGEPDYDAYVTSEIRGAAQLLIAGGFDVVWLTAPPVTRDLNDPVGEPPGGWPASDPARIAHFNQLVEQVGTELPKMAVVDLAAYLISRPGGPVDLHLRPDGMHFGPDGAKLVSSEWLGQAIIDAARQPH